MNRDKLPSRDVEDMLRRAFRDDMPAGLEEEMLRRFDTIWFRASRSCTMPRGSIAAVRYNFLRQLFLAPVLRRSLLAASALMMLITGGALRIGQSSSFLADSIALQQTAASVIRRLHHAHEMYSQLETSDGQGNPLRYSISWAEGTDTFVEIENSGGAEALYVAAGPIQASVLNLSERTPPGKSAPKLPQDGKLQPILDFLTPTALARLLSGPWQSVVPAGAGEKERAEYTVLLPGGDAVGLVSIDPDTFFPARLTVFPADSPKLLVRSGTLLTARFQWQPPSVPERELR